MNIPSTQNFTSIALVVDRSGSMATIAEATKEGVKEFISNQKQNPEKAAFTLVQFDHEYEILNHFTDLNQVDENAFAKQYSPRGSTALLDAIGRTIIEMSNQIEAIEPKEKPNRMVVAIMTDGQENSSREFTIEKIKELIEEKQKLDWKFIFLSADLNSFHAAQSYGFNSNSILYFDSSNVFDAYSSIAAKVTCAREGKEVNFTKEEREKLALRTSNTN